MTITLRNQAIANEVLRMFSIENTALEVELDAIQVRVGSVHEPYPSRAYADQLEWRNICTENTDKARAPQNSE